MPSADSRIWLISQTTNVMPYITMTYELISHPFNPVHTWSLGPPVPDEYFSMFPQDYTVEEWGLMLREYDFVLLFGFVNRVFITRYGSLFGGAENIQQDMLYAVEKTAQYVHLRPVGALTSIPVE